MTAVPSKSISPDRRILDRPRLTKTLSECDAKVILLLAPAGYGKTTLAQQWIKTVGPSIWLSCTQAHQDVVTFAGDLAVRLETLSGAPPRGIREYLKAQSTPQRSGRRVGSLLAESFESGGVQWIVIDDYHELIAAPEVEELVDVLRRETTSPIDRRIAACGRNGPAHDTSCMARFRRSPGTCLP